MVGWLLVPLRHRLSRVPLSFNAVGWESFQPDEEGRVRHKGTPSDLDATYGVIVEVIDPEDGDRVIDYFTAYARDFESWEEWWVYIDQLIDMYGMDL